jgi:hypothetical protein
MRRTRRTPSALCPHEQRVLDAFCAGRITAGQLSAALVAARAHRDAVDLRLADPQLTAPFPAHRDTGHAPAGIQLAH